MGWPRDTLPFELLGDVLEGAAEILERARVTLVGGHSIDDPEPKFGFAVTGVIDPDEILTNRGGNPGDALVLTKPIGTGVVTTAIKRGAADQAVRDEAVKSMIELNESAAEAGRVAGATAMTDVTGFGLLGHLREMLAGVGALVATDAVPLLPGAAMLAADGFVPGGSERNRADAAEFTDFEDAPEVARILFTDAQTSGGLLIALPEEGVSALLDTLPQARRIGELTAEHPGRVRLR